MLSSSPSSAVSPSSAITAASASFPSHRLRLCLPPLRPSPSTSSVSITVTSLRSGFHRSQHRSPSSFAAVAVLFSSHLLAFVATPSPVSSSSLQLHRLPLPLHLLRLRRAPPALSHRQLPCLSLFISSFVLALSFRFGHQDRAPPSPPSPPPPPPPSSSPLCCRTPPPLPCFSTPATITLLSVSSTICKLPPLPCSSAPTTIYRCLHLSSLFVAVIPTPSPSSPADSTSSPSSASITMTLRCSFLFLVPPFPFPPTVVPSLHRLPRLPSPSAVASLSPHRRPPPHRSPCQPLLRALPFPPPPSPTTPPSTTAAFFLPVGHGKLSPFP